MRSFIPNVSFTINMNNYLKVELTAPKGVRKGYLTKLIILIRTKLWCMIVKGLFQ